jgi:hypothetical protein
MFETKNHFSSCMLDFIKTEFRVWGRQHAPTRGRNLFSVPLTCTCQCLQQSDTSSEAFMEPSGEGLHFSSGSEVTCGLNPNLNIAKKIWNKSCTFTAHIKITPKNFRSKFETYIEKQKRETQMGIVYRETQIWIRELFMTDFSFLFLDVC